MWTADFAHNKWLYELTPYLPRASLNRFVDAMRDAAVFDGKVWAVPKQADAALLYYNKARVKRPPRTWQELYEQAQQPPRDRLRYQGFSYEGLTVNFLELAYAIGATNVVTTDRNANIDQSAALVALQTMADGIRHNVAPRIVVNQKETQSEKAFGADRAEFMRNWSPSYASLQDKSRYPEVAEPGWV